MKSYSDQVRENHLDQLIKEGYVKLPPFSDFCDLESILRATEVEISGSTFTERSLAQAQLLEQLGVNDKIAPMLYELARRKFNYKGDLEDQYHVSRYVRPGNSKECYRSHFDSHLFTLVLPISIPNSPKLGAGELVFAPNRRAFPKNELSNFVTKLYFKRFASQNAVHSMMKSGEFIVESFDDLCPILFVGMTTLHTNLKVSALAPSPRLTFLSHFFDPSTSLGIGALLRAARRR